MNRISRVATGVLASLVIWGSCLASVQAQGLDPNKTGLNETAQKAGYNASLTCLGKPGGCISAFAGAAISALAGLFGALFFGLILWGGFQYLLSQGEKTKVAKARETIVNAVVGLLIVVISYAIVNFVFDAMSAVTQSSQTQSTEASAPVVQ